MSYTALYRKFRPDNFDDVKGQEPIITTLKNQIKASRIGHAYLFCGSRGTGKTTVAKILAKVVNCENPQDGNPCNVCNMCKGISEQISLNVIEIDAASNNGVDNIREIVDEVRYSPTEGKYKVYIIDEVHMLSTGAFNALLKTLEEPPSYAIFILATTEVHKIPITILSRCQRFDFKRITVDIITDRLNELTQIENIEVEEKALRYIATAADGALRDALSLLDQCISFYLGEMLTYDKVLEVLGAVDTVIFSHLLRCIKKQDVNGCIILIDEIETKGRELGQFTIDFTWYLRNLLLLQISEDVIEILEISTENFKILKEDIKLFDANTITRYIRIFSELSNQIKYASRKKILVEIALIKLCRPQMEPNYDSLLNRIKILEDKLDKGVNINTDVNATVLEDKPQKETIKKEPKVLPKALSEDLKKVAKNWGVIITRVNKKSKPLGSTLQGTTLSVSGDNRLLIVVTDEFDYALIKKEDNIETLKETITEAIGKDVEVNIKYVSKKNDELNELPDLTKLINMPIEYED